MLNFRSRLLVFFDSEPIFALLVLAVCCNHKVNFPDPFEVKCPHFVYKLTKLKKALLKFKNGLFILVSLINPVMETINTVPILTVSATWALQDGRIIHELSNATFFSVELVVRLSEQSQYYECNIPVSLALLFARLKAAPLWRKWSFYRTVIVKFIKILKEVEALMTSLLGVAFSRFWVTPGVCLCMRTLVRVQMYYRDFPSALEGYF